MKPGGTSRGRSGSAPSAAEARAATCPGRGGAGGGWPASPCRGCELHIRTLPSKMNTPVEVRSSILLTHTSEYCQEKAYGAFFGARRLKNNMDFAITGLASRDSGVRTSCRDVGGCDAGAKLMPRPVRTPGHARALRGNTKPLDQVCTGDLPHASQKP